MPRTLKKEDHPPLEMFRYGCDHTRAARHLLESGEMDFLDSAGYLWALGLEMILKAWNLDVLGEVDATHDVGELYDTLRKKAGTDIGEDNEKHLRDTVRNYCYLRYPRMDDPIEIGTGDIGEDGCDIHEFELNYKLLAAIWNNLPKGLVAGYEESDPSRKGGRLYMQKRIPE